MKKYSLALALTLSLFCTSLAFAGWPIGGGGVGGGGGGSGDIDGVTATAPITGGGTSGTVSLGCDVASGSQPGCLSATNWTTFNGKQSTLINSAGLAGALSDENSTGAAPKALFAEGSISITSGSTLAAGTGGTLGTAAYTATTAYEVPLTFSTGLTRTVNSVAVNASQNITTLSNLTGNGFVKTSGGTGALSVDTTTYPTPALDNLTSVNINASLTPQTTLDLGSTAKPWRNLYLYGGGTYGTHYFKFDGTPTSTRTVTLPDSNTTIPITSQQITWSGPSTARTYTLPDAAATLARTDAGQTFTGVQTMTSPAFTTPAITTGINDVNGARILAFNATASGVNYLAMTSGATGVSPILSAEGACTNCDIVLTPKGTGSVSLPAGSAAVPSLRFGTDTGGWYRTANNQWTFSPAASTPQISLIGSTMRFAAAEQVGWGSSSSETAMDTGFYRKAAGIAEVNGGTIVGTTVGNARHILAARHQIAEITTMPTAAELSIGGSNAEDTVHWIMANDKLCAAFNRSGTVTYICAPLDSSAGAVTWTNGTSAP